MKDLALLEYGFLIEPSETWSSASEFESSFNDYLNEHGMKAKIVNSVGNHAGRRVLYICKIPTIPIQPPKQHAVKQQLKNIGRK